MKKYRQTMAKEVMNEAQLREYVENEVRNSLLEEGFGGDNGWGMGNIINWLLPRIMSNGNLMQYVGNYIKQNMSFEDLIGFVGNTYGFQNIINLICDKLGIAPQGPIGQALQKAIGSFGSNPTGN